MCSAHMEQFSPVTLISFECRQDSIRRLEKTTSDSRAYTHVRGKRGARFLISEGFVKENYGGFVF